MTDRSRGNSPEAGTAMIEFIWLTLLLLIPLVYVLLAVFDAQRAAFAVSSASQAAGRAFISSPDAATAYMRAEQAAQVALADQGVEGARIDIVCLPTSDDCLRPGSSVRVTVSVDQPLPFTPELLGEKVGVVGVDATHTQAFGSYRQGRS